MVICCDTSFKVFEKRRQRKIILHVVKNQNPRAAVEYQYFNSNVNRIDKKIITMSLASNVTYTLSYRARAIAPEADCNSSEQNIRKMVFSPNHLDLLWKT